MFHGFEPTPYIAKSYHGMNWLCKHDRTKTAHLWGRSAYLDYDQKQWVIDVEGDFVYTNTESQKKDHEFASVDAIFNEFDDRFEIWLAKAFETVKCDPNSHINFKERLAEIKSLVDMGTVLAVRERYVWFDLVYQDNSISIESENLK